MSTITTHVLDTAKGKPAPGIRIVLYQQKENEWQQLAEGITNQDGRIGDLLPTDTMPEACVYKMEFFTGAYFEALGEKSFYPLVPIVFEINSGEHYHIPLLLNPFGYTTYRGS